MKYIGETGRTVRPRKKEHMRSVFRQNSQPSLVEHVQSTGRKVDWDNMKVNLKENDGPKGGGVRCG